jgi:hypothetical protein
MPWQEPINLAKRTDLKAAIAIGLDESFTSLRESLTDLEDRQAWAFPIEGRNSIAWIALHAMQNLDLHAYFTLYFLINDDQPHRNLTTDWGAYPNIGYGDEPSPSDELPTVSELIDLLNRIESNANQVLDQLSSDDLQRPVQDWWEYAADACMRTIWHTMAHVRQIWALRGALGAVKGDIWPYQHWA